MKIPVYNLKGEEIGKKDLPAAVFEVGLRPEIVKQVIVAIAANQRLPWAHSKGRSDVRGGGRKPWRQKGTGRARHGSIRSPLWAGGGVTFGPVKERNYKKKVNKKIKRLALKMTLSAKAKENKFVLVDKMELPEIKTKKLVEVLHLLPMKEKSTLILLSERDEKIIKSAVNLKKVAVELAPNINADLLTRYEYVLLGKDSLDQIINTFNK